jgi:phosphatidylserine/phosphatidylglycerophosphate/cardiolipin synthase-like enzyme
MTAGAGAFPSAALLAAIRNGALTLAAPHAHRLSKVLACHDGPTPSARADALAVAPVPVFRRAASGILDAWNAEPAVLGVVVAAALSAAVETADAVRATQALDVVWTGPASAEVPVRLTREVLLEIIAGATSSLIIVSYAAYKVPEVVSAVADAARRGVDVRFILESAAGSGGRLSFDAAQAFRSLDRVSLYKWPTEYRRSEGGRHGLMHAKAAIADEHVAFITSANLTASAIEANMELGLLVRGGAVPRRLARHFRALIGTRCLLEVNQ